MCEIIGTVKLDSKSLARGASNAKRRSDAKALEDRRVAKRALARKMRRERHEGIKARKAQAAMADRDAQEYLIHEQKEEPLGQMASALADVSVP